MSGQPVDALWPDPRTPRQNRALNSLTRNGIVTVDGLTQRTPADLLRIRGFGFGSLADVCDALHSQHLTLAADSTAATATATGVRIRPR